jgi:zona occludens toxin (predicted ATPase)
VIYLVTGPPGSGKSFYAMRKLAEAIDGGKMAATNVELVDGWPEKIAGLNKVRYLVPGMRRRRAEEFRRRVLVSADPLEVISTRLGEEHKGEGRGVMVLDEAHNWMNSRTWSAAGRDTIIKFFTQHRKLGWDVYLLTQDADMLDKQVRTLFEVHIHLRNMRNARVMGVRLFPFNFFLAVHTWHSSDHVILDREFYRLSGVAKLYDSMAMFGGLDELLDQGQVLPRPKAESV